MYKYKYLYSFSLSNDSKGLINILPKHTSINCRKQANIPKELEELIDEKIYIDLEIHILTTRLDKSNQNKDKDRIIYFEKRLDQKFKERKKVNDQLRKENVKIFSPVSDDMFVQYDISINVNGGYKQGNFRYWKAALIYKLNKRLNVK
jgi:hypothetical protein